MARRWSRKRRGRDEDPTPRAEAPAQVADDGVRLDDDSHGWWAQADVGTAWKPPAREPVQDDDEKRDILAEHFGDDWRTNVLRTYTPPTEEELAEQRRREQQALDDEDPYKVLDLDQSATWDEIVAAHRHQARVHHPDLLFGQSDEERVESEDRIRVINKAYQELRVRRGK